MRRRRSASFTLSSMLYALALAAGVIGCKSRSQPGGEHTTPNAAASGEVGAVDEKDGTAESASTGAGDDTGDDTDDGGAATPVSDETLTTLGAAINGLGANVWGQLREQEGNLCISPASLHVALTMTWSGAKGETEAQMREVLHLDPVLEGGDAARATGALMSGWNAEEAITLRTANRLFGESSYVFEDGFVEKAEKDFRAPLERVGFSTGAEAARAHINDWVAAQTEDKIKDLIPPNGVDGNTRLVLTNAVYFQADWKDPFEEGATADATFHAAAGDVTVPMMHATREMPYREDDEVQVVQLPYASPRFSMLIVLPREGVALADVEASISAQTLDRWVPRGLGGQRVRLSMPRFELEPPSSLTLREVLEKLGMPAAFVAGVADFTGMADPPNPSDRLRITQVFHKTYVKVNEQGTEAAAATAVAMGRGGGMPKEPVTMTVDRPFLFMVRDETSGALLFLGRVADPS